MTRDRTTPWCASVTDEGISGYGEERTRNATEAAVLFYRDWLLGEDPTDVMRVWNKDPPHGQLQAVGQRVSAIEMALWDIAGKAAGAAGA